MKAITTRYHGPTTHRPARIIASDLDGNRATVPADGDFPYEGAHRAAAEGLCARMAWPGAASLVGGSVKGGMVWVFTHEQPGASRLQPPAHEPAPAYVHRFTGPGWALCGSHPLDDGDEPATHDPSEVTCPACQQLAAPAAEVDDWDAPTCLRWLAAHTAGPHHYAMRAADWAGEVARFAAYEQVDPEAWEAEATEELRAAVRTAMTSSDRIVTP